MLARRVINITLILLYIYIYISYSIIHYTHLYIYLYKILNNVYIMFTTNSTMVTICQSWTRTAYSTTKSWAAALRESFTRVLSN